MAFSKFDPHRDDAAEADEGMTPSAKRRVRLLRYGWWITVVYTAIGFAFLAVFWLRGNPF